MITFHAQPIGDTGDPLIIDCPACNGIEPLFHPQKRPSKPVFTSISDALSNCINQLSWSDPIEQTLPE